ncbi:peroxisomal membrane protein 2-like [Cynocephalus volans]|uniref:peroxisomal membrane protein 2-like n=1 Tax=Cynocephalus volans TaxID=110931 RepID=UPI002FCB785C
MDWPWFQRGSACTPDASGLSAGAGAGERGLGGSARLGSRLGLASWGCSVDHSCLSAALCWLLARSAASPGRGLRGTHLPDEAGALPPHAQGQARSGKALLPGQVGSAPGAARRRLPRRALAQYLLLLRLYPVLTKATTSGILLALGNLLAQTIEKKRKKENSENLDISGPLRYAIYGFFFTGPLSRFFYLLMESWIPSAVPSAGIKRLLLDRLLFAPAFLLLFFLIMNFLEGKDTSAVAARMRSGFWPALWMNWRVWTPVQFINVNYVPVQFRVLFGNRVALFWYVYLASLGK